MSFNSITFGQDHKIYGASSNGNIYCYNYQIQKEIQKFSGHTDSVLSLAHNKDSKRLYSGGEDGTLRIFGNFKFFFSPSWIFFLSISDIDNSQQTICIDVFEGKESKNNKASGKWVGCLEIDEKENWILTGGGDNYLGVWHSSSATLISSLATEYNITTATFYDSTSLIVGGNSRNISKMSIDGTNTASFEINDKERGRSVWDFQVKNDYLIAVGDCFVSIYPDLMHNHFNSIELNLFWKKNYLIFKCRFFHTIAINWETTI